MVSIVDVSAPASGFDAFDLHPSLNRAIAAAGFTSPRPIQAATIPPALDGLDVLGLAQTGTGKTAAFSLPILDSVLADPAPGPIALILAPTRELASQIEAEVRVLARFTKLRSLVVHGGVNVRGQLAALKREPHVVVGCPGRVLDLAQQGGLELDRIEILVLDEADHMFDMGFLPDVKRILARLPRDRQNLMFSATMPAPLRALAGEVLNDPVVVDLTSGAPAATIEHVVYPVAETRKRALLDRLLVDARGDSAIVFTRTKHRARTLARKLESDGRRAVALQGNMSQNARERAMEGFRAGRFDVLVATDIAARGIDVSQVGHVINFDVPNTPEAYTHRIGRTGRAERSGKAYTFVTPEDRAWLVATERMLGQRIRKGRLEGFEGGPAAEESTPRRAPASSGGASRGRSRGRRGDARGSSRSPSSGRASSSRAASGSPAGREGQQGRRRRSQPRARRPS